MASPKGKIVRLLGSLVLNRARVVSADDVGGFRRLSLQGDLLMPGPGTKVQVLLPSNEMRTYTPVASERGMVLLAWKHAGGPGAQWLSNVNTGDEIRFIGPQRSLELPPGPAIIVGDETSVAVAASFSDARPGQVQSAFQTVSVADAIAATQAVGLRPLDIVPLCETSRLVEAVVASHSSTPNAVIGLTGGAEFIVSVRSALRLRGIENIKTKTYWIPGKAGID